MRRCSGRMTKPPAYPFRYLAMSNSRGTKQTAVANPTWRQQPVRPEFPVAPSPRQEPYLATPHPTVKNLLDNLPRRHPGPPRFRLPASPSLPASPPFGEAVSRGNNQTGQAQKITQTTSSMQVVERRVFLGPATANRRLAARIAPTPQPNLSPFRNAWMTESVARPIQFTHATRRDGRSAKEKGRG